MASLKNAIDGLLVLVKYEPDGPICAEHDQLFAGSTPPESMTPEDLAALKAAGWIWDASLPSWFRFT